MEGSETSSIQRQESTNSQARVALPQSTTALDNLAQMMQTRRRAAIFRVHAVFYLAAALPTRPEDAIPGRKGSAFGCSSRRGVAELLPRT